MVHIFLSLKKKKKKLTILCLLRSSDESKAYAMRPQGIVCTFEILKMTKHKSSVKKSGPLFSDTSCCKGLLSYHTHSF